MGLKAAVQQAVLGAFLALGDLNQSVTYKSLTGVMIRDVAAGTSVAQSNNYTLPRAIFTKFRESEVDASVAVLTDSKVLIPAVDLAVQPKAGDIVIDASGRTWEMIRRLADPAGAVIILHVRTSR